MPDSTKTLTILNNLVELKFKENINLLNLLNANNISINQSCGGNGICTTCRFFVRTNIENVSEPSDLEVEHKNERSFSDNERLACQTHLLGSVSIEIPEDF